MKLTNIKMVALAILTAVVLSSAMVGEGPITKNGKQTIVNTTTIASDIKGYIGTTPLKIYILLLEMSTPPQWMSQYSPRCLMEMQEHSMCQPG